MDDQKLSASALYKKLASKRQEFLTRAHECAKLTIPTLVPTDTDKASKNQELDFEQPWQSIGAVGVNTFAAKQSTALFPVNSPFFQLTMGRQAREELLQLEGREADEFRSEIEAGLQRIEQDIIEDIEKAGIRPILMMALKQLTVAGNYLLHAGDQFKGFTLNSYVVRRDGAGNADLIITREFVSKVSLPKGFGERLTGDSKIKFDTLKDHEDVEIFTIVVKKSASIWHSWQEVYDEEVPGTRGSYRDEVLPWIPLRMVIVEGEDYGRSYVEELYGDLKAADDLSKAIVQGGLLSSRLIWLADPHGFTDPDNLMEATNGDIVPGRVDDVAALRADKMGDLSVAEQTLQRILQRLERAFLMNSGVQRDAERVTAFEIGLMVQEIEDTLGGYYSLMARELQLPLARRWLHKMQRSGSIGPLPEGAIEPVIITGVDALGRGHDLNRLRGFMQDIQPILQVSQEAMRRMKFDDLIQRFANGHSIDLAGAWKTDEEIAAEDKAMQQQAMQQEMISKGTGPAISAMAQMATQGNPNQ